MEGMNVWRKILGRAEHAVKMIRGGDKCMEGVLLGRE